MNGAINPVDSLSGRLSTSGVLKGIMSAPQSLRGSLSPGVHGCMAYSATTETWNAERTLIAEKNTFYIYTDYKKKEVDGVTINIPGMKIGDGSSYLIDMPFIMGNDEEVEQHVADSFIHITQDEREFWNNKVTSEVGEQDSEMLILTKGIFDA